MHYAKARINTTIATWSHFTEKKSDFLINFMGRPTKGTSQKKKNALKFARAKKVGPLERSFKAPSRPRLSKLTIKELLVTHQTKPNLMVFDIDGTIVPYRPPKQTTSSYKIRPGVVQFVEKASKEFDIVLFTAGKQQHASIVQSMFFSKCCTLFLGKEHLTDHRKFFCCDSYNRIVAFDDDIAGIHPDCVQYVQCPPRWFGDSRDRYFLDFNMKDLVKNTK